MSDRPQRVVFRADAGLHIGTGHLMRCLTLANALQTMGAEAIFVTRAHSGHSITAITAAGHRVLILPGNTGQPYGEHVAPPVHADWLEADWRWDAAETRVALQDTGADWLVVDHYALDQAWQEAAMPEHVRLLVIDDLADRPHNSHILLDQNFGRTAADYARLVPAACELRIGPAHALLRPEFARLRHRARIKREAMTRPERLLITLGGMDKDNVTSRVLDALIAAPLAQELLITVVMGANAPHLEAVRAQARASRTPVEVVVGVSDMAQRIFQADLCIGAVGSTAWERCALGLPTLQVVLADNQLPAAWQMAAQGLSLGLPYPDSPEFADSMAAALERITDPATYRAMARAAASLTEGDGAGRLAAQLLNRDTPYA